MEKVVRVFNSHDEAEMADLEEYRKMSRQQRLELLYILLERLNGPSWPIEKVARGFQRQLKADAG